MRNLITILFLTFYIIGCSNADFSSCSSIRVIDSKGICSAYYYQADYGASGQITQALIDCNGTGGNIVTLHSIDYGIGLKWIDTNTLEVSIPEEIEPNDQRKNGTYSGYKINYVYRNLLLNEPEYYGCNLNDI